MKRLEHSTVSPVVAQAPDSRTTGLILSGGGARAAYQVGVLAAIADLLPESADNPFPVIVGTSAGVHYARFGKALAVIVCTARIGLG